MRALTIEFISAPGCAECERIKTALRDVVASFGEARALWREVSVLDDMDRAVELGVLTPPAIAIDGELVFPRLPGKQALREALEQRLAAGA